MPAVCIITARGGSKRIPRKNIKDFLGKPIIAYSIHAALNSRLFDEVMVSTDDVEIATISRKYGAEVPFMRSAATSDDYAGTEDVLTEVVHEYADRGRVFDEVCCIYPTAPFVTADKIKIAYRMFVDSGSDSLIPVVKFSYPPQRCFVLQDNNLAYKFPEFINSRSQDLEPYYHDAGQFYFYKAELFLNSPPVLISERKITPYILSELEVQDIDNIEDWAIAEMKYKKSLVSLEESIWGGDKPYSYWYEFAGVLLTNSLKKYHALDIAGLMWESRRSCA